MEGQAPARRHSDIVVKRILRGFRRHIKGQYQAQYGRRHYRWVPRSIRMVTRRFYQEHYPCISAEEYDQGKSAMLSSLSVHLTSQSGEL